MKAYTFLHVQPATQAQIMKKIEDKRRDTKAIKDFDALYGTFDILITIDAEDEGDLMKVLADLGKIDGVTSTNTFVAAKKDLALKFWT